MCKIKHGHRDTIIIETGFKISVTYRELYTFWKKSYIVPVLLNSLINKVFEKREVKN